MNFEFLKGEKLNLINFLFFEISKKYCNLKEIKIVILIFAKKII